MRRFLTVPTATLTVVLLIAGCTSSDDTAAEPTTAASATTVTPPATATTAATTVAPPETATTGAAVASATLSETDAIATVEALQDALNAYDADAALAFYDEWSVDIGGSAGTVAWEQFLALDGVVGMHGTLSDCELVDGVLRCLWTQEETLLSGKAGVVYTYAKGFTFTDEGLVLGSGWDELSGSEEHAAFQEALGEWMASAHPEAHERFYVPAFQTTNDENWSTPEGVAELSLLIDEFVAQSDEYPLSDAAATTATATPEAAELRLTFDGDGCTYDGPTELQPGPVELFYVNESDVWSGMNLTVLDEGYTAQDVIDQLGPQPSKRHGPSWTKDMGTWEAVAAGGTLSWSFDLEAGVYVMMCARQVPRQGWEGWFGAGLTVGE